MQSSRLIAIALLAMLVIPIGMGYVMAFDEVEKEGWRTTEKVNLSEQILNHETPYYVNSNAPMYNGVLFSNVVGSLGISSPDYLVSSSTPSSIPINDVVQSYIIPSTGSNSVWSSVFITYNGATIADDNNNSLSGSDVYRVTASSGFEVFTNLTQVLPIIEGTANPTQIYLMRTSDGQVTMQASGYPSVVADSFTLRFLGGTTYTVTPYNATEISTTFAYVEPNFPYATRLEMIDGTVQYITLGYFTKNGSVISQGSTVIDGVNKVYVTPVSNTSIQTLTSTGIYADPAYGWRWPANAQWSAFTSADSITMYVDLPPNAGSFVMDLSPYDSGINTDALQIAVSGGVTTATYASPAGVTTSSTIGKYPALQIVISSDSVQVSGIMSWPPMYSQPVLVNSHTFDRGGDTVDYLLMRSIDENYFAFRVDTVEILGGYFPSTLDYELSPGELLPGQSYSIELPAIGIYGSSITIASGETSVNYTVESGEITVDGVDIRLLDALFSCTLGDGSYSIAINGEEILTGTDPMTITFGGEWSTTVTLYKMESVTSTSLEWIPGEFVFEAEDAALVGVITCAAVFIGLAMVRPFSGAKLIMLGIICGCGAIIFLIIL